MEKDKGFELFYNKLSYRRKFIRTIWLIPLGIVVGSIITYINIIVSLFYWLLFIVTGIKQLKYNYVMWKKEIEQPKTDNGEKNNEPKSE